MPLRPSRRCAGRSRARRSSSQRQAGEDRLIMATCREQHEAVPDRVVKAEALQEMKDRAERVQNAPDRTQPQGRAREDGCERVVRHDTAPTKQQAKNDGKAIEPPRKGE